MKKKNLKKLLLTVCCAALLVCVSIGATVAYLTSKATVTNTFTVGKVAITLDEAKVNGQGQPVKEEEDGTLTVVDDLKNATRVQQNTYKLMPGHEYTKDPTVHVAAGSEDSWIFVKVDNGISTLEVIGSGPNTIVSQIEANGWTELTSERSGDTRVYYQTYTQQDSVKNLPVFGTFKIADNANEKWEDINYNINDHKITVTAYAIQKDGFDDVQKAWDNVKHIGE